MKLLGVSWPTALLIVALFHGFYILNFTRAFPRGTVVRNRVFADVMDPDLRDHLNEVKGKNNINTVDNFIYCSIKMRCRPKGKYITIFYFVRPHYFSFFEFN